MRMWCARGGSVRPQLSACIGLDAINFFRKRRINTLILTCSGLDVESKTVYEVDPLIAEVKQAMIAVATNVILLITSDKLNSQSLSYLTDLSEVNHIVCDEDVETEVLAKLSENSLQITDKKPIQIHIAPFKNLKVLLIMK